MSEKCPWMSRTSVAGRHLTHGEMSALPDLGATVEGSAPVGLVVGVAAQDDFGLQRSGKPNEKPMFLNPAANPVPVGSDVVTEGNDAIGKGAGRGASSSSACRSTP